MTSKIGLQEAVWSFTEPGQKVQWPYNRWFSANIGKRIAYKFVREYWDRDLLELATVERLTLETYDPVPVSLCQEDRMILTKAAQTGLRRLFELLELVSTHEAANAFCEKVGNSPSDFKSFLKKIYKYLPTGAQMRQLVSDDDLDLQKTVDILASHKLGFSLALLDAGRTIDGRRQISIDTGIPEDVVLDLVRRADLTRMKLMGGGMVRVTWALGYKGLEELKQSTAEEYYARAQIHYQETYKGKPFDMNFKNVQSHIIRMQHEQAIVEE